MSAIFRFKIHKLCLILMLLISTVGCDQATKLVARDSLSVSGPLSYLGGTVRMEHIQNPGAFLSLGASLPDSLRFFIFTFLVGLFLFFTLYFLLRKNFGLHQTLALTLLVGGGVSNLLDRIFQGSVTDFLLVSIGPLSTGIFNIADVAIMAGVFWVFIDSFSTRSSKLSI